MTAMPDAAPIPIELRPHELKWAQAAASEAARLAPVLGENLITVHHAGSTTIPGISAKPILDLLPVVPDLSVLDRSRHALEEFCFQWRGDPRDTG